ARQAPFMTAVSPYIEAHFRRYLLFRGEVSVVHNGVPDSVFEIGGHRRLKVHNNGVTFAVVLQGWSGLKNGQVVLEAFGSLYEKDSGHRLLMFGTGHGPGGAAEQWAKSHSLQDGVSFIGPIPYEALMRTVASEVDILVHPALEESFSM